MKRALTISAVLFLCTCILANISEPASAWDGDIETWGWGTNYAGTYHNFKYTISNTGDRDLIITSIELTIYWPDDTHHYDLLGDGPVRISPGYEWSSMTPDLSTPDEPGTYAWSGKLVVTGYHDNGFMPVFTTKTLNLLNGSHTVRPPSNSSNSGSPEAYFGVILAFIAISAVASLGIYAYNTRVANKYRTEKMVITHTERPYGTEPFYCTQCGAKNEGNSNFCINCGAKRH
jgi:hypothetical protein